MKEIGGESKEEERESERDKVIVRVVKQNHRKASQSESIQSLPSNCTVAVARRLLDFRGWRDFSKTFSPSRRFAYFFPFSFFVFFVPLIFGVSSYYFLLSIARESLRKMGKNGSPAKSIFTPPYSIAVMVSGRWHRCLTPWSVGDGQINMEIGLQKARWQHVGHYNACLPVGAEQIAETSARERYNKFLLLHCETH